MGAEAFRAATEARPHGGRARRRGRESAILVGGHGYQRRPRGARVCHGGVRPRPGERGLVLLPLAPATDRGRRDGDAGARRVRRRLLVGSHAHPRRRHADRRAARAASASARRPASRSAPPAPARPGTTSTPRRARSSPSTATSSSRTTPATGSATAGTSRGPAWCRTRRTSWQAGNVIVGEPGVYLPDVGGFRWEDNAVVGDDGAVVLATSDCGWSSVTEQIDPARLREGPVRPRGTGRRRDRRRERPRPGDGSGARAGRRGAGPARRQRGGRSPKTRTFIDEEGGSAKWPRCDVTSSASVNETAAERSTRAPRARRRCSSTVPAATFR